jgi:uncharacterized protein (DUF58 family)
MNQPVDSFIDEDFLAALEKFRIASRRGVRSSHAGEHRTRQSGEGLEFLDYRKYHLGDDLRYVDWSVYGRLDKLFIKLFHAEANQTVHLLLDMSRSMGIGSPPKHICTKKIAAAVGYICAANLDKVGVTAFSDTLTEEHPPVRGKRRYPELLQFLLRLTPDNGTAVNTCLAEFAARVKDPGTVIVLSDLFDPHGYREGLLALTYRHTDVHLIHVMDHEELFWSRTGNLILEEVESGSKKTTFLDRSLTRQYRKRVEGFVSEIRNFCGNYGIHYTLQDTRIPFENFIIDYLAAGTLFR